MSQKYEPSFDALKSESARQRWELFHRAIATAKRSNTSAMQEAMQDGNRSESESAEAKPETQLSVAR